MRLTNHEVQAIKQTFLDVFKSGDIDLFVKPAYLLDANKINDNWWINPPYATVTLI